MNINSRSRMNTKPRRRHNKLVFFFFEVLQTLFDLLHETWHNNNVYIDKN